ncbi:MAG: FHA domain-containing protein [Nitrospiraceae bacterium]|nr:FHA domain-containing protein [Nitrospiraceae bacterium]
MLKYVKECPRCGRMNDELSEACGECGEFLGMVPAAPLRETPPEPPPPASPPPLPQGEPSASLARALYLDVGGACHEIQDGYIVGQQHPTSQADVQLSGLEGVTYVHRRHCRFELREDGWYVTALEQPSYTNPTQVNRRTLAAGEACVLHNGDRLRLAGVTLQVRVVE